MNLRAAISTRHLLAVFLTASVATMLMGPQTAVRLRHAAEFVLAPLGDAPMYAVTHLAAKVPSAALGRISPEQARRLRGENEYLRRLAAYWRYERDKYRRRAQILASFQRLYGPIDDVPYELIPARVVGAGSLAYDDTRLLGTGRRGGVAPGEAVTTRRLLTRRSKALPPRLGVIHANALVGRIMDTGAFTARLQLVSDRQFEIRARVRRVIAPGRTRMITVTEGDLPRETPLTPRTNQPVDVIAHGDGAGGMVVHHVKEYDNVLPGDLLTTHPDDGHMPTEVHIGKVTSVRRDAKDPHRVTLHIEPHADLSALREVFILSPAGRAGGP